MLRGCSTLNLQLLPDMSSSLWLVMLGHEGLGYRVQARLNQGKLAPMFLLDMSALVSDYALTAGLIQHILIVDQKLYHLQQVTV